MKYGSKKTYDVSAGNFLYLDNESDSFKKHPIVRSSSG
ncbi:hypothetical protein IWX76_000064 [Pedobacter sp. CAN_A7]